ncbi:uncharacterized protein METZ01_LOCUS221201 [marine metagenome]|uniref:Uncharacterized protein n=1 Tax=marine metagenome TaxID=408172 RepID=A0A382G1G5_9ZZZZ
MFEITLLFVVFRSDLTMGDIFVILGF